MHQAVILILISIPGTITEPVKVENLLQDSDDVVKLIHSPVPRSG